MGISNDPSKAIVGAYRAVVRTLGTWVAIVGPAEGPRGELCLCSDEGVLLLDAEPRLLIQAGVEDFLGVNSEVCIGWFEILASAVCPFVGLRHDNDVVALSEWVSEVRDRSHDDLRVVSGGLVARRAIVVPLRDVGKGVDCALESSALGAQSDARAVNPDVFSYSDTFNFFPAARVVDILVVEGEMCVIVRHGKCCFDSKFYSIIVFHKNASLYSISFSNL